MERRRKGKRKRRGRNYEQVARLRRPLLWVDVFIFPAIHELLLILGWFITGCHELILFLTIEIPTHTADLGGQRRVGFQG